ADPQGVCPQAPARQPAGILKGASALHAAAARCGHQWKAVEQRWCVAHLGTLDLEQAQLGGDAAGRREATDLAAGCEYAVARPEDREWVLAHRLAHVPRGTGVPEQLCDLAVGQRAAGRNAA